MLLSNFVDALSSQSALDAWREFRFLCSACFIIFNAFVPASFPGFQVHGQESSGEQIGGI
ncbi:hypothetical protein OAE97_02925 [Verrucomicrobia bacterium]|nr:hypothetical protein [Verrucomicrobiota bacterium]